MFSICAIFKNEYPFILEWIAYHRCLGIDHYYIADNISNDGSSELLIALDKINVIKRLSYPTENSVAPQIGAYNALLNLAHSENEWLAFIDADEFITPVDYEKGIVELNSLLEEDYVGAIALNWAVYGSSCNIIPENLLVTERLNKRASKDHPVNLHYKSIIRKRDAVCAGNNPHSFIIHENKVLVNTSGDTLSESNGLSKLVNWDIARINHYVIKSKAEFITKKRARGRATTLEKQLNRTINFFRSHDLNQIEENIPRWFINKVNNEKQSLINKLESIGYEYTELKYLAPLYRTAHGMGKGHIDALDTLNTNFKISGWAIDKNSEPVKDIIAVVDSIHIINSSKLSFRNRMDLARANLGDGINSGFNVTFPRPTKNISCIDFYGLDNNGLVTVEIKTNIDILLALNEQCSS